MQQYKNAILAMLLLSPVCVFLFFNFFSRNYYNLPIYYPIDSVQVDGRWKVNYEKIKDFALTNQLNRPFGLKDLQGKIFVADFVFTRCGNPTFCPLMSAEMQRVQEKFKDDKSIKIVSFSIDPEYDTPAILKKYAEKYQANPEQWVFLTGSKSEIYKLAKESFKVTALDDKEAVTPEFSHTNIFTLVDKEGRIRGYYHGNDREQVDKLILEMQILQYEYRK